MSPPTRTEPDLSYLLDYGGHALRAQMAAALAEIGDMDKTTMVGTVDALEKAGLAERRPSRTDRRARIIQVTEEGARVAEQSQRVVDSVHERALAALPDGEREVLLRALKRLVGGQLATPAEAVFAKAVRRARQRS